MRASGRKTVCVIGNFSGRNAGDSAILEGLVLDVRNAFGDVRFVVPTINPSYVDGAFKGLGVEALAAVPRNGCLRLLGRPVWDAIRGADLVLVTDAILFDADLWNPARNYLSSLSLLLPPARRRGVPIVLYNVSVGPVSTAAGRWCLRRVLWSAKGIILRDDISLRTVSRMGLFPGPLIRGGDCALGSIPAAEPAQARALRRVNAGETGRPVIGVNVNAYGSHFLRREKGKGNAARAVSVMASTIQWMRHELGADVWIFCTQDGDEKISRRLAAEVGAPETPVITNRAFGHRVLLGLMSRLSLMVGMRTHSLVLASSCGVPVVGIVTYPKTLGYLERIDQGRRCLSIAELDESRLRTLIGAAWDKRDEISSAVARSADDQRRLAREAVEALRPYLDSGHRGGESGARPAEIAVGGR